MNAETVEECGEVTIEATFAAMAQTDLARLAALAATFPTLAARRATDVADFKEVAVCRSNGRAAREAARFCLLVWDHHIGAIDEYYLFDLRMAWGAWDSAHRAAWQAWAASPWFA
jgi:hypothetical protein